MNQADTIASYIRELLDRHAQLESRVTELEESGKGAGRSEFAPGNPIAAMGGYSTSLEVTAISTPTSSQFMGLRVRAAVSGYEVDTDLEDSPLTVDVPDNASMPSVGDLVEVRHLGLYDNGTGVPGSRMVLVSGGGIGSLRLYRLHASIGESQQSVLLDPVSIGGEVIGDQVAATTLPLQATESDFTFNDWWLGDGT